MSGSDIPVVDLTPARLGGPADERRVASQIDRACRDVGFFWLCGHGIEGGVVESAHAAVARFFALGQEEKRRCALEGALTMPGDDYTPYGYSGLLEENAFAYMGVPGKPNDCVEKYSTGKFVLDDSHELPFPMGDVGAELRFRLKDYFAACLSLSRLVAELFTIPLGLDRRFFVDRIDDSHDSLRCHRYPARTADVDGDQGMGQHTDGSLVTLMTQTGPGIQVRRTSRGWETPAAGSLDHVLVNIGDLLAHWTDGAYKSTEHRVVLLPEPRQSIVFFKLTNDDELVAVGNRQMEALFGAGATTGGPTT